MARRRKKKARRVKRMMLCALAGLVAGVPISYEFQSGIIRALVSRGQYARMVFSAAPNAIWKQVNASGGPSADPLRIVRTLILTCVLSAAACAAAFLWFSRRRR